MNDYEYLLTKIQAIEDRLDELEQSISVKRKPRKSKIDLERDKKTSELLAIPVEERVARAMEKLSGKGGGL